MITCPWFSLLKNVTWQIIVRYQKRKDVSLQQNGPVHSFKPLQSWTATLVRSLLFLIFSSSVTEHLLFIFLSFCITCSSCWLTFFFSFLFFLLPFSLVQSFVPFRIYNSGLLQRADSTNWKRFAALRSTQKREWLHYLVSVCSLCILPWVKRRGCVFFSPMQFFILLLY